MAKSDDHNYVKVEPVSHHLPPRILQAEIRAINQRREHLGVPPVPHEPPDNQPHADKGLIGLCLSGGGIRSSTFNLGVLQGLERFGILPLVDYLSTVSGGGYIGSALNSFLSTCTPQPFEQIIITGVPAHASLSNGERLANGDYRLLPAQLPGLILNMDSMTHGESNTLTLQAYGSTSEDDDQATTSIPLRCRSNLEMGVACTPACSNNNYSLTIETSDSGSPFSLQLHISGFNYPFPFRHRTGVPESAPFRHLREYSNYLTPKTPFSFARMPALFLRGLLVNSLIILPLILFLAIITTIFADNTIRNALATRSFDIQVEYDDSAQRRGKSEPVTGYRNLYLNLTPDVEWDKDGASKYIILSGLPKNSFSNQGLFLNKGRWLFRADTAQSLKLTMMIPESEGNFTINVRAWQTDDQLEEQLIGVKEIFELTGQKRDSNATLLQIKKSSVHSRQAPEDLTVKIADQFIDQGEVILKNLVPGLGLSKPTSDTNRFLMIENLKGVDKLQQGRYISPLIRTFENDEISSLDLAIPLPSQDFASEQNVRLIFWQSGNDSHIIDPVGKLLSTASYRTITILSVYAIILFLTLAPIFLLRETRFNTWNMRDLVNRWVCGGGLTLAGFLTLLVWQVPAIYFFYRLHYAIGPVGLFGGADKLFMGAVTFLTMVSGVISSLSPPSPKGQAKERPNIITNFLTKGGIFFFGLMGPMMLWLFYLNFCGWALHPQNLPGIDWQSIPDYLAPLDSLAAPLDLPVNSTLVLCGYLAVYLVLRLISHLFFDANDFSLHPFYRDRLSQAFLFSWKSGQEKTRHNDRQTLSGLGTLCPYHLINTTLNLESCDQVNLRGRKSEFFMFSKEFTGSQITGYQATSVYEQRDKHIGLGTAMAISAAAASPRMGRATNPVMAFMMAMLNIRLGYWACNPNTRPTLQGVRQHLGHLILPRHASPFYLFAEMLGWLNEKSRKINLSDGGHLENMGLYELVRRRCKFIIVSDAEADPKMSFKGLGDAIRLVRIDMGVKIDIDVRRIRPLSPAGVSPVHYALGTIHYGPEEQGMLLYIKSSLCGNENVYIKDYKAAEPTFPHQTTADQFFDEEQFEAYRALGYHICKSVFTGERGKRDAQGENGLSGQEFLAEVLRNEDK